jgi:hypothetical protein
MKSRMIVGKQIEISWLLNVRSDQLSYSLPTDDNKKLGDKVVY